MTLATAGPDPWAAPVYYALRDHRLCFFSGESSRHVSDALRAGRCAAAVFRDSEDWRDIEGLQMDGQLRSIDDPTDTRETLAQYIDRFPTVRQLFDGPVEPEAFLSMFRARLYAFTPARAVYTNNREGLGTRVEIQWPP